MEHRDLNPTTDTTQQQSVRRPEAHIRLLFEKFQAFVDEYRPKISLGGVFIETAQPKPVGATIACEFKLADGFRLCQAQGDVLWVRPQATAPDRPTGMGIRFQAIDDDGRKLILKILEEQLKAGGEPFEVERIPADAVLSGPTQEPSPRDDPASTHAREAQPPAPQEDPASTHARPAIQSPSFEPAQETVATASLGSVDSIQPIDVVEPVESASPFEAVVPLESLPGDPVEPAAFGDTSDDFTAPWGSEPPKVPADVISPMDEGLSFDSGGEFMPSLPKADLLSADLLSDQRHADSLDFSPPLQGEAAATESVVPSESPDNLSFSDDALDTVSPVLDAEIPAGLAAEPTGPDFSGLDLVDSPDFEVVEDLSATPTLTSDSGAVDWPAPAPSTLPGPGDFDEPLTSDPLTADPLTPGIGPAGMDDAMAREFPDPSPGLKSPSGPLGSGAFPGAQGADEPDAPLIDPGPSGVDTSPAAGPLMAQVPVDEPLVDQPLTDEPLVDQPLVHEPLVDQPLTDEPLVDQPLVHEPLVDQPLVHEPLVDRPLADVPPGPPPASPGVISPLPPGVASSFPGVDPPLDGDGSDVSTAWPETPAPPGGGLGGTVIPDAPPSEGASSLPVDHRGGLGVTEVPDPADLIPPEEAWADSDADDEWDEAMAESSVKGFFRDVQLTLSESKGRILSMILLLGVVGTGLAFKEQILGLVGLGSPPAGSSSSGPPSNGIGGDVPTDDVDEAPPVGSEPDEAQTTAAGTPPAQESAPDGLPTGEERDPPAAPIPPPSRPSPPPPSPPSGVDRPAAGTRSATLVRDIVCTQTPQGTEVVIELDGGLGENRYGHNPLSYDALKEQIVLQGITTAYHPTTVDAGTLELDRIRTGLHDNRLNLVFDLSSELMTLSRIQIRGNRLEVMVSRSR